MPVLKKGQNQNNPQKPYASVKLVIDPPEAKSTFKPNFPKNTLFVEVIHGNEKGELSKQWIPLPVKPEKEFGVQCFDMKAILDFNFPLSQKNVHGPFILSGIGQHFGNPLTLSIPISSGECQLECTPEGNVSIKRAPANLDLKIDTHATIQSGAKLKCRALNLTAKNIKNEHDVFVDNLHLNASEEIVNNKTLSGKTTTLSAKKLENSLTGKILGDDINIIENTAVENSGLVEAKENLNIKTSIPVKNNATGTLKGKNNTIHCPKLTNKGKLEGESIILKRTAGKSLEMTLDNEGGKIIAKKKLELQQGTVNNERGLLQGADITYKSSGWLSNQRGNILATNTLDMEVRDKIQNAHGRISGMQNTKVHSQDIIRCTNGGVIRSKKDMLSVSANKILVDETSQVRGKKGTELLAKSYVHTSTPIMGDNVHLNAKYLDIDGGVCAPTKAIIHQTQGLLHLKKQIKGGEFKITADQIENDANLGATGKIDLNARDKKVKYSLVNNNNITSTKGDIDFDGNGILHRKGQIKTHKNIKFKAVNFNLAEITEADENIELHHLGGAWEISDNVKALGELSFHFPEGQVITVPRKVVGSLKYVLPPTAKRPFRFLADQEALKGHFKVEAPTPLFIGDDNHFVSIKASEKVETSASLIVLDNGLIGGDTVRLLSKSDILLGRAGKDCAVGSVGGVEFNATGKVVWDHLKFICGGALTVNGTLLDDVASSSTIIGDVTLNVPLSKHYLLTETVNLNCLGNHCNKTAMISYQILGETARALTKPASLRIGGRLKTMGETYILGSHVQCNAFEGKIPVVHHFAPYQKWTNFEYHGNPRRKTWWLIINGISSETPFTGIFSPSTPLKLDDVGELNMQGIISAPSIEITGVTMGIVGFQTTIQLPASESFMTEISLTDFVENSSLFELTEDGYPTIFRPILPFNMIGPLGPITVIDESGILRPNIENRRCLLTPIQEREYIVKAMMRGIKRGHISPDLTDPLKILEFLRENAEKYMKDGETALVPVTGCTYVNPMLGYKNFEMIHASGKVEQGLVPYFYLPKSMDNPRTRDWAGGLFALEGGISVSGKDKKTSVLQFTGHMDANSTCAKGKIVLSNFHTLIEAKRTTSKTKTVCDSSSSKSFGGLVKKNKTTSKNVTETFVEPGCTKNAYEILYKDIETLIMQGSEMFVGKGGVSTENVGNIQELVLLAQLVQTEHDKKRSVFGSTKSITNQLESVMHPTRIISEGPVHLESKVGYYDTIQVTAPEVQIKATHLSYHVYIKQLEENRRAYEIQKANAKKQGKRQQKKMLTKMIAGIAVGMVFAPMLAQGLLTTVGASSLFVTETALEAAYVVTKGAMFGGISAAVRGDNPLKSAIQGGIFAGVGFAVENMLSSVESLKELETLCSALKTTAIASLDTALNGGNIVENVLASVAADFIANKTVGTPDGSLIKDLTSALVKTAVTSTLTNSTTLGQNLVASGLGSFAQNVGGHYGEKLAKVVNPSKLPAPKLPDPRLNTFASNVGLHNFFEGGQSRNSIVPNKPLIFSAPKPRGEKTPLKIGLKTNKHVVHKQSASKNTIESNPTLQGTKKEIDEKLVKFGRANGRPQNPESAWQQGPEKVFASTVNALMNLVGIGQAHAVNLESINEPALQSYNLEFEKKVFLSRGFREDMQKNMGSKKIKFNSEIKLENHEEQKLNFKNDPKLTPLEKFNRLMLLTEYSEDAFVNPKGIPEAVDKFLNFPFKPVVEFKRNVNQYLDNVDASRENIYKKFPQLRQHEREYQEGTDCGRFFSSMIPDSTVEVGIIWSAPHATNAIFKGIGKQVSPLWSKCKNSKFSFGKKNPTLHTAEHLEPNIDFQNFNEPVIVNKPPILNQYNSTKNLNNTGKMDELNTFGSWFPKEPLRQNIHGDKIIDFGVEGSYTQLGTTTSYNKKNKTSYQYPQAREFDANGKPVKDIDFTDHKRPDLHTKPHQHRWVENKTGGSLKREDPEPLPSEILETFRFKNK